MNLEQLKYPIGKYVLTEIFDETYFQSQIHEIELLPERLEEISTQFTFDLWAKPYRPNGWTGAQLVHHLVDSHINSYIRFKLAITEDNPIIKPYNENLWAELPDEKSLTLNPLYLF